MWIPGNSSLNVILIAPGMSLHDLTAVISPIVSFDPRVSMQSWGPLLVGLR